jgi:hypothetical protein
MKNYSGIKIPKDTDRPARRLFHGPRTNTVGQHRRLASQFERVKAVMMDGKWRTLWEIADLTDSQPTSVSARLRDFTKKEFGSHTKNHRIRAGSQNQWEYQIILNPETCTDFMSAQSIWPKSEPLSHMSLEAFGFDFSPVNCPENVPGKGDAWEPDEVTCWKCGLPITVCDGHD